MSKREELSRMGKAMYDFEEGMVNLILCGIELSQRGWKFERKDEEVRVTHVEHGSYCFDNFKDFLSWSQECVNDICTLPMQRFRVS